MKKYLSLFIVCIMIISLLASCDFLPEDIQFCNVEFYVDGELYVSQTAIIGTPISMPFAPTKENHIFVGWYLEGNFLNYAYDFSTPVILDTKLHARFTPDATKITNMITFETMKSLVTVINKCYNTAMGGFIETESSTSQGSGVIIDISDGYCFVLTNYHVASFIEKYSRQELTIEDAWGNQYKASYYKTPSNSVYAMDPEYDLALLCFKYEENPKHPLAEIKMGDDPKVGDFVVSLGAPANQRNAISYGEVITYKKLQASDENTVSNVTFDIIYHNAFIDHGSSGGPLVNATGYLVGLNFAGFESNKHGCAIPLSKIVEFLNQYVYEK